MKIHYASRLMPEFADQELPERSHAFQIVRVVEYEEGSGRERTEDVIVDSPRRKYTYLTAKEAAELAAELMRNLELRF